MRIFQRNNGLIFITLQMFVFKQRPVFLAACITSTGLRTRENFIKKMFESASFFVEETIVYPLCFDRLSIHTNMFLFTVYTRVSCKIYLSFFFSQIEIEGFTRHRYFLGEEDKNHGYLVTDCPRHRFNFYFWKA